jgi:hypothetical protein
LSAAIETEAIEPTPSDILLIIRDGLPYLKSPAHDEHGPVEPDYIVMLGMSIAFNDPRFRAMMNAVVDQQVEAGRLDNVISAHRPNSTVN